MLGYRQITAGTTNCGYSDESDQHQQTRLTPMKSARQIFLSGMLAAAVMAVVPSPLTQQNNSTPRSPGATATPEGEQIPPPPLPLRGGVKENVHGCQPDLPPPAVP